MQTNGLTRKQLGADSLLLLVTLIWGSTFVMVKDAVADYPVFPFLSLRFSLATLALLLIGGKRLRALDRKGWGAGVLIGLFLFAGYALQTVGLCYTSASKAGFITGLSVVLVPLISTLWLRRLPTPGAMLGVGLAAAGLAMLTLTDGLNIAFGDLLVLGCALSFALHIVSVSAFAPRMDTMGLTIVQVGTVAVVSGIITLLDEGLPLPSSLIPTGPVWFAATFTGILATALAFTIQTTMQRFTTPTHTALIFAAEPVVAALAGVVLAGEAMTSRAIAGGVMIVTGTIVGEIRWSEYTATKISRFLAPNYVSFSLLLILGLADPVSRWEGVLWALAAAVVALGVPLILLTRELRKGRISDWHMSRREERLQPVPVFLSVLAPLLPAILLYVLDGPRLLLVAFVNAFVLVMFNLAVTLAWKISQHVSAVAATTTLITAILGAAAAPTLLLIPLVAWARVRIGAHTVMQTVAGGVAGVAITLLTLSLCNVI
ncbi:MAG: DMT family transporter [Chloroflexi bacterium]|jgi:drug/metabolite transporter (DMT)-like permease/membrane-associated phospholipid phosphatase|nr:DMT family transporter [Chloroflexota bacterium]